MLLAAAGSATSTAPGPLVPLLIALGVLVVGILLLAAIVVRRREEG